MLDAAELRRASASDAGAVAQYLRTIDSDELDALLDAFADAERKKSGSTDAEGERDAREWHALVHVLLRTRATRQRTATRVLQSLWRGLASEMDALRWVSEISLAYMASLADGETAAVAAELRVVLQIALQFVRDAMAAPAAGSKKVLPQLLALVPVLLHLLVEAATRGNSGGANTTQVAAAEGDENGANAAMSIVYEHVVQLLELPWDARSVPYLLELLREHTMLVSPAGWTQLRQSVEQLITPTAVSDVPMDGVIPLVRECLLLAASRSDAARGEAAAWVNVARSLLRRLPTHMRQESEFNVQMSLHQYPALASLICDVLLAVTAEEDGTAPSTLRLDASDAVLLLHVIRASKPLLHHHLVGSALAASANDRDSVFSKAQRLILSVIQPHPLVAVDSDAAHPDKHVRQAVAAILDFGGRQVHARVWKAHLLHDLARVWSDANPTGTTHTSGTINVGVIVVEIIFSTVPDVREEILQTLLESSRVTSQSELAFEQLRRLVASYKSLIAPYRQLLEDWLSTLASLPQHSKRLIAGFSSVATLVAALKDFYNFSMVLLRKQLPSPHASDRQIAVDVWCSWLESGLPLDAQQEEEVVLAIKHAVQLSQDRGWTFQRLERIFQERRGQTPTSIERHPLREASLIEFHRLFVSALKEFVEPATNIHDRSDSERESEDEGELETEHTPSSVHRRRQLRQFSVSNLDSSYGQNSSVASALQLGALLESVVGCLLGVEGAMANQESSKLPNHQMKGVHLGRDVVRWLDVFVQHRDECFQWISSGDGHLRVGDPRFVWALAARVSLSCTFCNLSLRRQVEMHRFASAKNRTCVWELLESQLSIARLWRKFSATTPMADNVLAPKDNQLDSKILQTAASTLGPFSTELLSGIVEILNGSVANSGASLDGIMFLLDAYIFKLSVSRSPQSLTYDQGAAISAELEALITMYATVTNTKFDPAVDVAAEDVSAPVAGVLFTTYGETLGAQYPKSMRHLVVPETPTALTVTLDARAAEEVLSRVCVALSKAVHALAHNHQLAEANQRLMALLPAAYSHESSGVESLHVVALRLLGDVKRVMDDDAYAKFRLAAVALVRTLLEISAEPGVANRETAACGSREEDAKPARAVVADAAYELMCDHVVSQAPLLRALLALSFPSVSRFARPDDATVDRAAAVLSACGFCDAQTASNAQASDTKTYREKLKEKKSKKKKKKNQSEDDVVRVRRRRLRQISDEEDDEEDDEVQGDQDGDTVDIEQFSAPMGVTALSSFELQRQPRLTTRTSQNTALVATLNYLESTHSLTTQALQSLLKSKASSGLSYNATTGLFNRVVRIQSLLSSSVFASADGSWISARTLAKLSSVLESSVKNGKYCCVAATSARGSDDAVDRDMLVQSFISSVAVTVRGRTWLAMLRDATTQAAAKSKLSATILKLDVFLLDVPTLVGSLMKADALPLDSKRSLRVFLSTVEADLALATSMALSRSASTPNKKQSTPGSTSSLKRQLVGVVPIVHTKRRKRLRSRHAFIDSCLAEEDGDDAFADLEDFIA